VLLVLARKLVRVPSEVVEVVHRPGQLEQSMLALGPSVEEVVEVQSTPEPWEQGPNKLVQGPSEVEEVVRRLVP
jgi:hypothetical protein